MITKILGGSTCIILCIALFLSWKNRSILKVRIEETAKAQKLLEKAELKSHLVENEIKQNNSTIIEKTQKLINIKEETKKHQKENKELQTSVTQQEQLLEKQKKVLSDLSDKTSDLEKTHDLITQIKQKKKSLVEIDNKLTISEQEQQSLQNKLSSLERKIEKTTNHISLYNGASSAPNLNTKISKVFNDYGFVMLKGGDNLGIIKGTRLNVKRKGKSIAQLLVSSVERSSASADILPKSLLAGVSLRVGDQVIAVPNYKK